MPIADAGGRITQPWLMFLRNLASGAASVVAGVSTFMGRSGAVTLTASDVDTALGYVPGTGNVSYTGSPINGQAVVWTSGTTIGPGSSSSTGGGTVSVVAAVALTPGQLVNFGATGVQLADAATGKPAHGFVTANVSAGTMASVSLPGQSLGGLTVTAGTVYYLGASGAITSTYPTAGGSLAQQVGVATDAATLAFAPYPGVTQ